MVQLWLVTLPTVSGGDQKLIDNVKNGISHSSAGALARVLPFEIPPLAIGSLDILMGLSDELIRLNNHVEVSIYNRTFINYYLDILFNYYNYLFIKGCYS